LKLLRKKVFFWKSEKLYHQRNETCETVDLLSILRDIRIFCSNCKRRRSQVRVLYRPVDKFLVFYCPPLPKHLMDTSNCIILDCGVTG